MFSAILAISSCEMFPIIVFEMPLCSQLKIYTVSPFFSTLVPKVASASPTFTFS